MCSAISNKLLGDISRNLTSIKRGVSPASWRYTSPPGTPVSCRSDSPSSPRPKLEASPRSSQQPMDWPATQGQQHPPADLWRRSTTRGHTVYVSDATVLDDYALTTTTTSPATRNWLTSSRYHIIIVVIKRQNRPKVGTDKPKLKVKMQSVSDDDVRKRLLEKPRLESWRRKAYSD